MSLITDRVSRKGKAIGSVHLSVRLSSPRKHGSVFLPAFVCMSACLSVTTITKKIVDGFVLNFMGRFLTF